MSSPQTGLQEVTKPQRRPAPEPRSEESMTRQVYAQLREAIMTGRFLPGQLLSLRGVAAVVGSSTMPVRTALNMLHAEGALINGTGRALMVPPMTMELLEEIRDVRIALEGCVVERAAKQMTDAALAEIAQLMQEMDLHIANDDVAAYLRANFAFHTSIYRCGASDATLASIQSFWLRIGPFVNLMVQDMKHMKHSMSAHRKILRALKARDGAAARAGIEDDIRESASHLSLQLLQTERRRPPK